MHPHSKLLPSLLSALILFSPGAFTVHAEPQLAPEQGNSPGLFQNGDRWTVVGDSITQGGAYSAWVYLYYLTRFPDRKIELMNAGNSGDSAGGALVRYNWDIQAKKSTVATVMFGMNDVGRGLYDTNPATPEIAARRASSLQGYRDNMTKLADRLKVDGTRIIFLGPSIYDETAKGVRPPQTGVNGALGECAKFMRKLAGDKGGTIIDFNGPMTALNARILAKDPSLNIIRPDRVHPNDLGHFVMSYLFLKAQQAPGTVSNVCINAGKSRVETAENATVNSLVVTKDGITFGLTEKALPYPVGKEFEKVLAWVPFQEELNREMLKVGGLAAGDYQLSIDGKGVRRYNATELSKGVNLALEQNTPQALQSAEALELMRQWQKLMSGGVRLIPQFEFWRLKDVPHPVAFESVRPRVERELERLKTSTTAVDRAERDFFQRYFNAKPKEAEMAAKLAELVNQMRDVARPSPHVFQLAKITNNPEEKK